MNSVPEFSQLISDVEANIEDVEKCNALFEDFLTVVRTSSRDVDGLELAVLYLCLGRYEDSYNILRSEEQVKHTVPDVLTAWCPHHETRTAFLSARQWGGERRQGDIQEDVEWLLPRPHQLPTSPYQYLYIGQTVNSQHFLVYCMCRSRNPSVGREVISA